METWGQGQALGQEDQDQAPGQEDQDLPLIGQDQDQSQETGQDMISLGGIHTENQVLI